MWVVLIHDGVMEFPDVHGPFETREAAEAFCDAQEEGTDPYATEVLPVESDEKEGL